MSYNAFLINTGSKLVLIDTDAGGKLDDQPEFHGTGRLMANLRAAGYQPEQIDEIYITHLGPDHVGGLTLGTERAFPNAILPTCTRPRLQRPPPARRSSLLFPLIRSGSPR
jgi:glyoxylase-like metal-dependent hydrolase (beta-lactamase superfamily II)